MTLLLKGMLTACARICECIGQELLTYISAAMPFLIQCADLHHEKYELDDTSIESQCWRSDFMEQRRCPGGKS